MLSQRRVPAAALELSVCLLRVHFHVFAVTTHPWAGQPCVQPGRASVSLAAHTAWVVTQALLFKDWRTIRIFVGVQVLPAPIVFLLYPSGCAARCTVWGVHSVPAVSLLCLCTFTVLAAVCEPTGGPQGMCRHMGHVWSPACAAACYAPRGIRCRAQY